MPNNILQIYILLQSIIRDKNLGVLLTKMVHKGEWPSLNLTGNTFASILKVYSGEAETHIFLVNNSGEFEHTALVGSVGMYGSHTSCTITSVTSIIT